MATVVSPVIEPETDAIKAHLEALFAPARETYPRGLIELRYGRDGKLNQSSWFNLRDEGVAEAATFAANRNREGANVYVGVNPRKPSTNTAGSGSAADVEIAFWHFADLDKADAVANAGKRLRDANLAPTMTVNTGTVPHRRPHLYWQLEEPVSNMQAWSQRQLGIAQALEGDHVIDPPRIMRLAGTVNFPTQDKLQRGYQTERTSLKDTFDEERAPVSPDEVTRAFPVRDHVGGTPDMVQGQNTLQAMAAGGKTKALITAALTGDQWHNNVRDLVARLARLGRTDAEIMLMADGLTMPGYTVADTSRELSAMLRSARTKYDIPEPDETDTEEFAEDDGESVFETLSLDQIEDMPPPTYLIDGVLPEHGLTFIYGDPGAGKSFIALDMALRLAFGMDWHGAEAQNVGVLYIAGEGRHGLGKRVTGWRKEHGLEGVEAPFKLLPVAVHMLDKASVAKLKRTIAAVAKEVGFPIGLIVIDTVSRSIPGQDENKQDVMSMFIDGCADLYSFTSGAIIGVHHSGKDKEKGMRGSTVLLGGCDAAMKVTGDGKTATLKMEKQKDDEQAGQIYMEMRKREWADTGLSKPISTLIPFKSETRSQDEQTLSNEQIGQAFVMMEETWENKRPLSHRPETKRDGRYAPGIFAMRFGGSAEVWSQHLTSWLQNGCVVIEQADARTKVKGLQVIERLGEW